MLALRHNIIKGMAIDRPIVVFTKCMSTTWHINRTTTTTTIIKE